MDNTLERITSDEDYRDYLETLKQYLNRLRMDIMMKYTLGTKQSDLAIAEYQRLSNRESVSSDPY